MRYLRPLAFVALFFTAAACGKSNPAGDNNNNNNNNTTLANGSMSASIAGSSFNANTAIAVIYIPGAPAILSVAASDSQGRLVGFALSLGSTGTYSINDSSFAIFVVNIGSQQWQADAFVAGGSGTITFTTFTANHAVGTFNFTGNPVAGTGSTGSKSVSNGAFNVTY